MMPEAIPIAAVIQKPENVILATLAEIVLDRECIEIRGQNRKGFWWCGFFDNEHLAKLAHDAAGMDSQSRGIYITLNATNPSLLARRSNRIETYGIKANEMTCDDDIINWDFLPIDIDPKRPAGISSTQNELDGAYAVAEKVIDYLSKFEFPKPIIACSGNGWHLLYRINLPRCATNDVIVKKILYALSKRFDTDKIGVDVSNSNPSRIFKLYGTMARKGENTSERPHRRSFIKEIPDNFTPVPSRCLSAVCDANKNSVAEPRKGKSKKLQNPKAVTARHPALLSAVGKMVRGGFAKDAIVQACVVLNSEFENPKPDEILFPEIAKDIEFCQKKISASDDTPSFIIPILDPETGVVLKNVLDCGEFANFLYTKYHVVNFKNYLYVYDLKNHIYRTNINELGSDLREIYMTFGLSEKISLLYREVETHSKNMGHEPEFPFDLPDGILLVENCALHVSKGKITVLQHSHEIRKTVKLPVEYDPNAPIQPVLDVLSSWVDESDVPLLIQILAQALYQQANRTTLKRNYLLQGETDAGKSTYLDLLMKFCGETQISDVSLQEICADVRFLSARLESKILNIYDDLKDIPLSGAGKLKKLDGRTTHEIERKGRTPYTGHITAPHVFSCNQPPTYDAELQYDEAWWGRWEFVSFPFSHPKDVGFQTRTFTKAFLSGLLNLALAELLRIDARGQLLVNRSSGEIRDRWGMLSNPLKMWIRDNFVEGEIKFEYSKRRLFEEYTKFCEDTEVPIKKRIGSEVDFGRKLPAEGFVSIQIVDTLNKTRGLKNWVWRSKLSWKGKISDVSPTSGRILQQ